MILFAFTQLLCLPLSTEVALTEMGWVATSSLSPIRPQHSAPTGLYYSYEEDVPLKN